MTWPGAELEELEEGARDELEATTEELEEGAWDELEEPLCDGELEEPETPADEKAFVVDEDDTPPAFTDPLLEDESTPLSQDTSANASTQE